MTTEYPKKMDKEFAAAAEKIFGEYLVCCFINGRAAIYKAEKTQSDIDVFVVLKDSIREPDDLFKKLWEKFALRYRDIHLKYGFRPDNAFPGDYATPVQIEEVAAGRGFVVKDGHLYVQPMLSGADESAENDYRIFRSMWMIGRCINGDVAYFNEKKRTCVATMVKYLVLRQREGISVEGMIAELTSGDEKEKYGFDKRYEPAFSVYMTPILCDAIQTLVNEGWLEQTSDKKFKPTEKTLKWEQDIIKRIQTNSWQATNLINFQDPATQAAMKEIFANSTEATNHWDKLKSKS